MSYKVAMTQVKQTKGAVRYQEIDSRTRQDIRQSDPGCVIGTLYIRKQTFGGSSFPIDITVTIEET